MTKNSTSILDVARYTLCSLFAICFFQMLQLFGRQVGFQISFCLPVRNSFAARIFDNQFVLQQSNI